MDYKYAKAILGGTFDHLHRGHQKLLDAAFENSESVAIGLTTEKLYQKKFLSSLIEPYEVREKALQIYLQSKAYNKRGKIIPLTDIYGESLDEERIDAIFVTEVTYPNALVINKEREKIGFPPLVIEKVLFVKGTDGETITSERIRRGEIDRLGYVYGSLFAGDLLLPETLRPKLKEPLGTVIANIDALNLSDYHMAISVGDVITATLKKAGIVPDLSIIDFRTQRQIIMHHEMDEKEYPHVANPHGTIQKDAVKKIHKAYQIALREKKKSTLVIEGEEDLLALPAILLAPLGSVVLYGQYNKGIVVNKVTEEMKEKVKALAQQFEEYSSS